MEKAKQLLSLAITRQSGDIKAGVYWSPGYYHIAKTEACVFNYSCHHGRYSLLMKQVFSTYLTKVRQTKRGPGNMVCT